MTRAFDSKGHGQQVMVTTESGEYVTMFQVNHWGAPGRLVSGSFRVVHEPTGRERIFISSSAQLELTKSPHQLINFSSVVDMHIRVDGRRVLYHSARAKLLVDQGIKTLRFDLFQDPTTATSLETSPHVFGISLSMHELTACP